MQIFFYEDISNAPNSQETTHTHRRDFRSSIIVSSSSHDHHSWKTWVFAVSVSKKLTGYSEDKYILVRAAIFSTSLP